MDVLVTDQGVAVNPARVDLAESLRQARLPVKDIHDLKSEEERHKGPAAGPPRGSRIVALVEYRDGSIIDVVRQTAPY